MFRIKICGVTSAADAEMVAEAGADAIGLNFYAPSPRYLPADRAAEVAQAVPARVLKVGLFVNALPAEIDDTVARLDLDLVQLHGDEPPEALAELRGMEPVWRMVPIMRAFRARVAVVQGVAAYLDRCRQLNALPDLVLLDAQSSVGYGGTGKLADWQAARDYLDHSGLPPLVLAGGLTAANVGEAIRAVRPAAVDTASGVEHSPGHKDRAKVLAFIAAAHGAFACGLALKVVITLSFGL